MDPAARRDRLRELHREGTFVIPPGFFDRQQVARIVAEAGTAVNCILLPGGLTVPEMATAGVRRVSLGRVSSSAAYAAFVRDARHVLDHGTPDPDLPRLTHSDAVAAFGSAGGPG